MPATTVLVSCYQQASQVCALSWSFVAWLPTSPTRNFCRIPNMFLVLLNINCTYEIPRRQTEGAKTFFFFWKKWHSFSLNRCEFDLASDWISFCRRLYIIELLWCQLQLSVGSLPLDDNWNFPSPWALYLHSKPTQMFSSPGPPILLKHIISSIKYHSMWNRFIFSWLLLNDAPSFL